MKKTASSISSGSKSYNALAPCGQTTASRKLQIEIVVNIDRLPTSRLEKKTLEDIFRFENLIGA